MILTAWSLLLLILQIFINLTLYVSWSIKSCWILFLTYSPNSLHDYILIYKNNKYLDKRDGWEQLADSVDLTAFDSSVEYTISKEKLKPVDYFNNNDINSYKVTSKLKYIYLRWKNYKWKN